MIPGIGHAAVFMNPAESCSAPLQWPATAEIHADVRSAAQLASSQQKTVTTTLSAVQGDDSPLDMVIALPLIKVTGLDATLALLVRIRPSQQAVVMQVLRWGENWLGLLQQQPLAARESSPPPVADESPRFGFSRSRLMMAGIVLLLLLMSILDGNYRVTAPASLEGRIQRAIVAPYDGYIDKAYARAGEIVSAGDMVAELDSRDLLLQQQRHAAEKNEHTRQYRQALATRDKAQAHIYKSQVNQSEAQLGLLQQKISRSSLLSPLDGVIISGDLSRSLGAPVTMGDVLFEIAPLDEYRLVIRVDEKQVIDVQPGQTGMLSLQALHNRRLPFVVNKVSPVFEESLSGIAYRVDASIDDSLPSLRPGMQGLARIDIDRRSFLWIYLHEVYYAIRLWLWSWLG